MRIRLGALIMVLGVAIAPATAQPQNPPPAGPPQQSGLAIAGTITSVSPNFIIVTRDAGHRLTVWTPPATKVVRREKATLAQIRPGDRVRVTADRMPDGRLAATAVEVSPPGLGIPMLEPGRPPTLSGPGGSSPMATAGDPPPIPNGPNGHGQTVIVGTVQRAGNGAVSIGLDEKIVIMVPPGAKIDRIIIVPPEGLVPGTPILVQGRHNLDGSITASVILIAPPPNR